MQKFKNVNASPKSVNPDIPHHFLTLFSNLSNIRYRGFTSSEKECFTLVRANDLFTIENRKIYFDINLLDKCDSEGKSLLDLVIETNNLELKNYIFNKLYEHELAYSKEMLITYGIKLDQSTGCFESLLAGKKNIHKMYIKNFPILYFAALKNSINSTRKLLEMRANPNKLPDDNHFPLYVAAQEGHLEIVQLLASYGANLETKFRDGYTPLYIAAQRGHLHVVKYLMELGANVNARCNEGSNPLYIAAQEGNGAVAEYLLMNGADTRCRFRGGYTPLYVASRNGHTHILKLLFSHCTKEDVNVQDGEGSTPLYVAAQNGYAEACELLLANGANVESPFLGGYTPLYIAAQNGFFPVIEVLIRYKAKANHLSPNGSTALYVACQNGHIDVIRFMCHLNNKNDFLNLTYSDGYSPLYVASQKGHSDVVKELVWAGADVNLRTRKEASCVYVAAQRGHLEIVKFLIANGADVNLRFQNGYTPLHIVCLEFNNDEKKCIPLIFALSHGGVNFFATDLTGKMAVMLVTNEKIKNILLLEQNFKHRIFYSIPFDIKCIINTIENHCAYPRRFAELKIIKLKAKEAIWLDLLKNTNSDFAHTVILYALLENADARLTRVVVDKLGFNNVMVAINEIHFTLINYFDGNKNLLAMLILPILEGINKNKKFSSGAYKVPLLCFNSYEKRMKLLRPDSTDKLLTFKKA